MADPERVERTESLVRETGLREHTGRASNPGVAAWLHARGVIAEPAELDALVAMATRDLAAELRLDSAHELPPAERRQLERAGVDFALPGAERDPVGASVAAYAALLRTALDVDAVARRVGVSPTRIRQRLGESPRSLIGLRVDNTWRIPLFQFAPEGGFLPGLAEVVREIASDAHPLSIQEWFLGEHVDLPADEEEELHFSPRDWLLAGRDPSRLAELAREI